MARQKLLIPRVLTAHGGRRGVAENNAAGDGGDVVSAFLAASKTDAMTGYILIQLRAVSLHQACFLFLLFSVKDTQLFLFTQ